MAIHQTEFVYEPFAGTDEYRAVNTDIVQGWLESMAQKGSKEIERLLDIATGIGTMVHIFVENLPKHWNTPTVICLDQSRDALEQAKLNLESKVRELELIHCPAEEMTLPDESVDVALWGNGIHYLEADSQERVLASVKRALRKGGWLFFNSAFYAESRPPETIPFYRAQVRRAVEYLKSKGISREQMDGRPSASNFLSRDHYETLLQKVGFKVEEVKESAVRIRRLAMEHISGFQQYAAGALHGYNPHAATEAMRLAVAPAMERHGQPDEDGVLAIKRNWLAVSARVV